MKKTKKILASLGVVAAVAGVGVMAAGCGDEFANAEEIKYTDYATFQTAETPAVNVLDGGYEVNITNTTEADGSKSVVKVHARVQALDKEAAPEIVANMAFTIDMHANGEMYGLKMDISYHVDVTVVNTKVEDVDTVMVYFTMNSKNYQATVEELEELGQGLQGGSDFITGMSPYSAILQYMEMLQEAGNSPMPNEEIENATYKKIASGDTTKFQITSKTEPTKENTTGNEKTYTLVYNKKQLTEFSYNDLTTFTDEEGTVEETLEQNYEVKGFSGTISAPSNADKYTKLTELGA